VFGVWHGHVHVAFKNNKEKQIIINKKNQKERESAYSAEAKKRMKR